MSKIVKPIALDETLQATNTKLNTIDSDLKTQAGNIKESVDSVATYAGHIKTAIDNQKAELKSILDSRLTTLDTDIKATNDVIGEHKDATVTALEELANALVGTLTSVKSVNGKYGVVVLDSGDILISKNLSNSKTVKQMVDEMEAAIAKTPLTFTAEKIEGTDDDYLATVSIGTPA